MTYVVIPADGSKPDFRDGAPSTDDLIELVGNGLPEKVNTALGHEAVLWVNEDFISLGLQRNVLGTVLAALLSAPLQPYAGPVVVTSLDLDPMGGYSAGALEATLALTIEGALHDSAVVVGLHDCELTDDSMPKELREKIREIAELARTERLSPVEVTAYSPSSADELMELLGALDRGEAPPGGTVLR